MKRRTALIAGLGLLSSVAHAELKVSQSGSKIELLGPCSEVRDAVTALGVWKRTLGEEPSALPSTRDTGPCRVDVATVLPQYVRETLGSTKVAGPNCWNTALLVSRMVAEPRFTSAHEMTFWMNSPVCKARKSGQPPQIGDIGAVRVGTQENHSFVYLTPELVFEKIGPSSSETYRLTSPAQVAKDYSDPRFHTDYFECQSFTEFVRTNADSFSADLRESLRSVDALECQVSRASVIDSVLSKDQLSVLQASTATLLQLISDAVRNQGDSGMAPVSKETWVWISLLERLGSIQGQLRVSERQKGL